MISETLSLTEAAKFLGVSPPTMRKMALKLRTVTCIKYGTRLKFRLEDLETFKKNNTFHAQDTTPDFPSFK